MKEMCRELRWAENIQRIIDEWLIDKDSMENRRGWSKEKWKTEIKMEGQC